MLERKIILNVVSQICKVEFVLFLIHLSTFFYNDLFVPLAQNNRNEINHNNKTPVSAQSFTTDAPL